MSAREDFERLCAAQIAGSGEGRTPGIIRNGVIGVLREMKAQVQVSQDEWTTAIGLIDHLLSGAEGEGDG